MNPSVTAPPKEPVLEAPGPEAVPERSERPTAWLNGWHLPVMLFSSVAAVVFRRLLFQDTTLAHLDYSTIHVPFRTFMRHVLAQGQIPLWIPNLQFGLPFVANGDTALFYPLQLPFLLIEPGRAIGLLLWLHTVLAMLTMYAFCRLSLGRSRPAAAVAGLIFGLNGFALVRLGLPGLVYTGPWVPLLLLAVERSIRKSLWWCGVGAGAVGLTFLAGHPQQMFFSAPVVVLVALLAILRRPSWLAAGRGAAALVASAVGGFALGAVQALPQAELVSHSLRSHYSFADATFGPYPADRLWAVLFPDYWRLYFGENAGWIGLTGIALALLGIVTLLRRRAFVDLAIWGTVVVVNLALCVGASTPLYRIALTVMPGLDRFRFPLRFVFPAVIGLCVLAAYGADELLRSVRRAHGAHRRDLIGMVGIVGVIGAASATGAGGGLLEAWEERRLIAVASALALALIGAAILAARRYGVGRHVAGFVLVIGVALELVGVSSFLPFNHPVAADFYRSESAVATYLASHPEGRVLSVPANVPLDVAYRSGVGNTILMTGASSTDAFGGQWPPADLVPLQHQVMTPLMFDDPAVVAKIPLLRWLGVRYVIATSQQANIAASPALRERVRDGDVVLYELRDPGQRARAFCDARFERDPERITRRIFDSSFSGNELWIEGRGQDGSGGACGSVEVTDEGVNAVSLRAELPRAGWVLLADTWYPGWRATIDGKPVAIRRGGGFFRAVPAPAGSHRIDFTYAPRSFRRGLTLSLTAALIGVLLIGIRVRRSSS